MCPTNRRHLQLVATEGAHQVPHARLDLTPHFVVANGGFYATLKVRNGNASGTVEAVTLLLKTRHATAVEAIDHAGECADLVHANPARYKVLFDFDFD